LLEPNGVRLHWITDGPDIDATGLAPANVADDPSGRRGPERWPLRAGDWNQVKLALDGPTLSLELNGVKIYERALAPALGRVFSFYHDKARTLARVRAVVLQGDWPAALPTAATTDLAALRDPGPPAERHARADLIGATYLARDADQLLEHTRALAADRRYALLTAWVLPGEEHGDVRLVGAFTPFNPAPPPTDLQRRCTRVQVGGGLVSPARELVAAAQEAGKLDELTDRVRKIQPRDDLDRRGQLALLAMIALAQGDDARAEDALQALKPRLENLASEAPESERWPELIALSATIGRPKPLAAARALAETLAPEETAKQSRSAEEDFLPYWMRPHRGPVGEIWHRQAAHIAARADGLAARPEEGDPPDGWASVVLGGASARGLGAPPGHWATRDGEILHIPGHEYDFLMLRTPLLGDFALTGELVGPWPAQLSYGGVTVGLSHDRKQLLLSKLGQQPRRVALDPPLEAQGAALRFRWAVQEGSFSFFLNDRKLYEGGLPTRPDPWLALYQPATARGGVRALKLEGRPKVPDQIELSTQPDLTGWLSLVYNEATTGDEPAWEKRGDEILGRRFKDLAGAGRESLLQYHRPMLEDGQIRYEFYYEPNKVLVHPALDRLAFLLGLEGVKIHWLTDTPFERSGLLPDNAAIERDKRRGPGKLPLKEKDWNGLTLVLAGDKVTLTLNGTLIYERPLEPTNQRVFGLFHDIGQTEARVRAVTYQGAWPRQRPPSLTVFGLEQKISAAPAE
jgi:hypothetical protein